MSKPAKPWYHPCCLLPKDLYQARRLEWIFTWIMTQRFPNPEARLTCLTPASSATAASSGPTMLS